MASNIKFKRSAVQNRVPTTAQLELGELALNTYDGKLYTEINTGSAAVVEIGSKLSSLVVDGDNGAGNGDVVFHGATAGRDLTWDASDNALKFADNTIAYYGSDNDLNMYHTGGQGYIKNTTGTLYIQDDTNVIIGSVTGSETGAKYIKDGAFELYHNNNLRLATTDDGADISGTGSLKIPVGTTAQRSGSPTAGDLRYNTTTGGFEGYSTSWGELGGGGIGIGSTSVNPASGVVGNRIGVGFTDINVVGSGISVTGYGSTIVLDFNDFKPGSWHRTVHSYTATANQTTFTGLNYVNGTKQIAVYLNGARLSADTYTATSGTSVVLDVGASVGDEVEIMNIHTNSDVDRKVNNYTATAGQTTFTGLSYNSNQELDVYLNGIRLAADDYTATSGNTVVLATGASVGDVVDIVSTGDGQAWRTTTDSSGDVYKLTNVGIGTDQTTEALNIRGNVNIVGIVTATTFSGVDTDKIEEGNTSVETVDTGSDGHVKVLTEGTERFRIDKDGVFTVTTATVNAYHKLINPNNGYNNALYFESASSTLRGLIGIAGGGGSFSHTSTANDLVIRSNNHLVFGAGGNQGRARIDSSGRMQIGTVTEGHANADDLTISSSGDTGITIRSGTSSGGRIYFSDAESGTGEYEGKFEYIHSDNSFRFATATNERLRIDSSGNVQLLSTDAGSSAGPELKLYRNSASPADADYLGQIKFAGESDTGVERNYAKITGKILDASNGTEDGIIEFAHIKAGSQVITGRWRSDSLQLLNGTNMSIAGNLTVTGDLQVDGTNTVVNSTTMTVDDKNIVLGSGAANDAAADGGGITLESGNGNKTWNWVDSTDAWTSSEHIHLGDSKKLLLGASSDLQIYHSGDWNYIQNHNNKNFVIQVKDNENAIVAIPDSSVQLYHNNIQTLATTDNGIVVYGAEGGDAALHLYSDEGDDWNDKTRIRKPEGGDLMIEAYNGSAWEDMARFITNDAVYLYFNGSKTFETLNGGAKVTGNLTVTGDVLFDNGSNANKDILFDASANKLEFSDGVELSLGNGSDLRLYHDGSNSQMRSATGSFLIMSDTFDLRSYSSNENMIKGVLNGAVELYHNGVRTFATEDNGAYIYGPEGGIAQLMLYADEGDDNADKWRMAAATDESAFRLYNFNDGGWETNIKALGSGAVELYHNNNKRFETTNAGATLTGELTAGSLRLNDNGANSPILQLSTDDNSPWAFQVKNDSYTNSTAVGLMGYQANSGEFHVQVGGNGAYENLYLTFNNGSSTASHTFHYAGCEIVGTTGITAQRMTLNDNGAGSPILDIRSDDGSPWQLQIANDSYSTGAYGLNFHLGSTGIGYMRHLSKDSTYGSVQFGLQTPSTTVTPFSYDSVGIEINTNFDLQFSGSGAWTGNNLCKIQHHSNNMYIVGGTSGIRLRTYDGSYDAIHIDSSGDVNIQRTTNCSGSIKANSAAANAVWITTHGDLHFDGSGNWTGNDRTKIQHHSNTLYIVGGTSGIRFRNRGGSDETYMNNSCEWQNFKVSTDIRFPNGTSSWSGDVTGKIQHHSNWMYLVGGSNGISFRGGNTGNTDRWYIDGNGMFRPASNNTYDIGTGTHRVRNVYTNDLHLSNEGSGGNDVDGTTGNYTIQEGADELYLINNKSGKKYKFNLTEVS